MIYGIALLLLTGLCWVGIAVVISHAARRRLDINFIQFAASAIIALAAGGVMMFQTPAEQKIMLMIPVFAAGSCNYIMIKLMRKSMLTGSNSAVWGITQSALICPFLMGMLFFGVTPTLSRLTGIILILLGILFFSRAKPIRGRQTSWSWLFPALGAFTASGMAQCLANLPSYWTEFPMTSELRACLVQLGTIGMFVVSIPFERQRFQFTGTWRAILLLSSVQILSLFFFFYRGLNIVADHGGGSIGYPVAQGTCIALFQIYSVCVLKEQFKAITLAALVSLLLGIIIISL